MVLSYKVGETNSKPIITVSGFVNKEEAENYMVGLELGKLIGECVSKGINTQREIVKSIKKILKEAK